MFVFLSLCFRNPFLLFSPFTLLSFNFPKVPLLSFLLLCFSPLLFLSRFLSSYPLTVAFFVSKLPSPFSFKRSLSPLQNSTSPPSHLTSLLFLALLGPLAPFFLCFFPVPLSFVQKKLSPSLFFQPPSLVPLSRSFFKKTPPSSLLLVRLALDFGRARGG